MEESIFGETSMNDVILKYACQLVAFDDKTSHAMGTAVWLAPGLLLTAGHILDECGQAFRSTAAEGHRVGEFTLCAIQVGPTGSEARFDVRWVSKSGGADIAVLSVDGDRARMPANFPRTSLIPPAVGERIAAFGFPGKAVMNDAVVDVDPRPRSSIGRVSNVYPQRRDSSMLTFPCFEVDARFDDSMSGGPVFNSAGHLIGLICSSIPATDPGGLHTSYCTLLWPLAGVEIWMPTTGGAVGASTPMVDLLEGFGLLPLGFDRVRVAPDRSIRLFAEQAEAVAQVANPVVASKHNP